MIIGASGSGKSTLAHELGNKLNLTVYHLDPYFCKPGWVEVNPDLFKKIHQELLAKNEWIIEGGIMGTLEDRMKAADTIIYLHLPIIISLWGIIKRRIFGRKNCSDLPAGCKDQISWHLVNYVIWRFPTHYHKKILLLLGYYANSKKIVIILKSANDKSKILASCVGE